MIKRGVFIRKKAEKLISKNLNKFRSTQAENDIYFFRIPLSMLNVSELSQNEKQAVENLRIAILKKGYTSDTETLSLFALSKKEDAARCIRKYISYCTTYANLATAEGIRNYILCGHFLGVSIQPNGVIVLEFHSQALNMNSTCVYSMVHVVLTNIFFHITYKSLRKGIAIVLNDHGFRMRLWKDRIFFSLLEQYTVFFRPNI